METLRPIALRIENFDRYAVKILPEDTRASVRRFAELDAFLRLVGRETDIGCVLRKRGYGAKRRENERQQAEEKTLHWLRLLWMEFYSLYPAGGVFATRRPAPRKTVNTALIYIPDRRRKLENRTLPFRFLPFAH